MHQNIRPVSPNEEDGYTLVETLVALAILTTVLVPTAQFVGYLVTQQQPSQASAAYRVASSTLETWTAASPLRENTETVEHPPWTVTTTVQPDGPYVLLRVDVRRTSSERSVVTLKTRRAR